MLKNCRLCARNCSVNRIEGKTGFCRSTDKLKIARAALHQWEEPCISGNRGSGTVFFTSCSLDCVFCQNHCISQENSGREISIKRLSEIFLELQDQKAHNINLVTPTHFVPQIIEAIKGARDMGLTLPVVYNTSSYDNIETIRALEGYVDIYLPDLKYYNDKYAIKYSKVKNYFNTASKAIEEMVRQTGKPVFDDKGMMKKGVIIRHMMLPGLLFDSKKVIDYIYNKYGDKVYISLMNQYTPYNKASQYPEINKKLSKKHYDGLINYALELGVKNGFIQEEGTCSESFIPPFDNTGV
ncbi:radical SAM protein [Clostridium polynesiense]|uniref:radical SAM protein n=1 Tax=Clostridium polynesiense TaxID=1325933 RepID=UPI00058F3E5C|nr:radical SAM protein [Clostridium polynesiense]